MGQRIDDLSLDTLLELFQAITEPRGADGGWRAEPSSEDASAEGGPFERVEAPDIERSRSPDEPVPMAEASDSDSGTWLWLEH
jgi:hypothetical protein